MHPTASKYNEKFKQALAQLNKNQLEAVNQLEGPVLVIAGPGTGKTQILAARIGKVLLETDTSAHEILCLTYTDAGAVAMRKRLFDFIGPEAYRVNIYTFHAFCNEVIQENLEYFGKLNLEPISELESVILLHQLIDSFEIDNPLKRFTGEVYYDATRLKKLFSTMKNEAWDEQMINLAVKEYLDDLPLRDEFIYQKSNAKAGYKVGDVKQKKIAEKKEKMELLLAAVSQFKNFEALMKAKNRYDYDDMIIWVLNAFRNNAEILRHYQEKYQYILVDEFQDTSGSQNELLKHLINYWEAPNVFVVGDDDQSIFKFQGANTKNILDFANDYVNTLHTVVLKENYRSSQPILELSKVLISNNRERLTTELKLDKNLSAANSRFTNLAVQPVINEYENPANELVGVASQIIDLIKGGTQASEIAVIYRNHSQVEELINYLNQQKIAVNTKRKIDILNLSFGEKIVNILRYLSSEMDSPYSGDELLFEILHYDFFDIPPIEIAKASVEVSKENYITANKNLPKTSLRRYISELKVSTQQGLFDKNPLQNMKFLMGNIDYLLAASVSTTIQQFFQQVIAKMGILKYIMEQPDKGYHMEVLTNFYDFLKDESRKKIDLTLAEFIKAVELMKSKNIRLSLNQVIFTEEGLNFLTAHGSKGLEFEHVFLLGCTKGIWDGKGRNDSFSFPDTLTHANSDEEAITEESRRLFYVAITRAKQYLHLSYTHKDKNGKDVEASRFVGEILASLPIKVQYPTVDKNALFDFMAAQFNENDKPRVELIDKNYINQLLDDYALSVTHLNNYLECPLKFYFQSLIKVPSGKNASSSFGLAVHYSLNKAFVKLKENGDEFPLTEEFMTDFKSHMYRNRDAFTKEEFKLKLDYGEKILPPYYNQGIHIWNKIAVTERSIKNVEVDGVPIKGNLDKVEFMGKQVNVIDYKTGNPKKAVDKLKAPNDKNPNGGDYWRQAVFYKILIDNDRTIDWEVLSAVFEFVEPNKDDEYLKEKIVITPDDTLQVLEQIKTVYGKIMAHEFETGCGKKDCDWCHFVKSNFTQQASNIMLGENEDD